MAWRSFFSCAVFTSSLSFAHIIGFSSSGRRIVPFPAVASSSGVPHHLIRLISPVSLPPLAHHGGGGACHLSSKQRRYPRHDGPSSSSHPITGKVAAVAGSVSSVVSSCASRPPSRLIPGHQRGEWGRTKQSKRTRKNMRNRDGGTGEQNGAKNGSEHNKTTRRGRPERERPDGASKQGEATRTCGNHAQEQTPLIIFARPPHRRFPSVPVGSPASNKSPAPRGVG